MSNPERVRVRVPTAEGAPCPGEGVWAELLDLPIGLYRVASVTWLTDGVSLGDTVRCDVARDGELVAVEVVERAPHATVVFGLADDQPPDDVVTRRLVELDAAIQDRLGPSIPAEGGLGLLAVCVPPDRVGALLEVALACSTSRDRDDEERIIGDWRWHLASHPQWTTPEAIRGSGPLLDRNLHVVGVAWTGDDPVASRWDPGVRAALADQAATDPGLRRLLDERRYLAVFAPIVRMAVVREFGLTAVGAQPFPIGPPDPALDRETQEAEFWRRWEAARDTDGKVRWCDDETVDGHFRAIVTGLGLDPDADPRAPA